MTTHILRVTGFLLAALLFKVAPVQAQTEPIKYGKIDLKDLTAAPFAKDSSAAAVVLCDYGITRFVYGTNGWQLQTDRITRIKILKKSGYDAADVQIGLYHQAAREEKLTGLRGYTYNLVNGQMVKTKLELAKTFTEDRTTNVRIRKFTMPDVREGSVIEYAYGVTSDFLFNLQDWTFQREIPVRWSEYRASIPEYFDYRMVMQGYNAPAIQTKVEGTTQFVETYSGGFVGEGMSTRRVGASSETTTARTNTYVWAMKDLPAMTEEPYMTTVRDYVSKINFEMAGYRMPNTAYHMMAGTWSKINMELLASDNFGAQLDRGNFLRDQMLALKVKYADLAERTAAVRAVVLKSVVYDGTDRYSTDGSLKRAFDAHRGTSADVNLLLLACLRDAGLEAQPVLLSTRDHGRVNQYTSAMLEKFNYVIALVPLGEGKEMLVDATEPLLPCGVLPERCLSQVGRLITLKEADSHWVDLTPTQRYVHFQQVQLTLAPDGSLSGTVHEEHAGYAGATERSELTRLGEKKYVAEHTRRHDTWTVPTVKVLERETLHKPLTLDYTFTQPAEDAATAGLLYLSPLRSFMSEQNPFRREDRLFPVDFGAGQDETMMITLNLPAGYELTEIPKPAVLEMPDGGGRYLYSVTATGGTVQLTSRMSLRKPIYAAADYQNLREFYRMMLTKQAEKLVIKKKA